VSGGDGPGDSLGIDSGADRAALPEGWQWHPADADGADAAHLLHAAVVQSLRPCDGGCVVRLRVDAALRRDRADRGCGAGRVDDPALPAPARAASADAEALRARPRVAGTEAAVAEVRDDRRCDDHRCTALDQE